MDYVDKYETVSFFLFYYFYLFIFIVCEGGAILFTNLKNEVGRRFLRKRPKYRDCFCLVCHLHSSFETLPNLFKTCIFSSRF